MFSSIFGKRRSSPVEDEAAAIPGPKSDDGFEIIDPTSPNTRGSLYPSVSGVVPYPQRPAPPAPVLRPVPEPTFHYLQGVPFTMSKELTLASNKDAYSTEISDLLVFLTNKVNMNSYDYDFTVEKSVLKEI